MLLRETEARKKKRMSFCCCNASLLCVFSLYYLLQSFSVVVWACMRLVFCVYTAVCDSFCTVLVLTCRGRTLRGSRGSLMNHREKHSYHPLLCLPAAHHIRHFLHPFSHFFPFFFCFVFCCHVLSKKTRHHTRTHARTHTHTKSGGEGKTDGGGRQKAAVWGASMEKSVRRSNASKEKEKQRIYWLCVCVCVLKQWVFFFSRG
jgi:hypothetical protein